MELPLKTSAYQLKSSSCGSAPSARRPGLGPERGAARVPPRRRPGCHTASTCRSLFSSAVTSQAMASSTPSPVSPLTTCRWPVLTSHTLTICIASPTTAALAASSRSALLASTNTGASRQSSRSRKDANTCADSGNRAESAASTTYIMACASPLYLSQMARRPGCPYVGLRFGLVDGRLVPREGLLFIGPDKVCGTSQVPYQHIIVAHLQVSDVLAHRGRNLQGIDIIGPQVSPRQRTSLVGLIHHLLERYYCPTVIFSLQLL